jgi:hypothetical protein
MGGEVLDYLDFRRTWVQLQPKPPAEPKSTFWDEFCGLILEIIAELSPCPEPTLFVVAATRGLQRFGDGTLDGLSKLLGRCTQELQARGLVYINEQRLITPARSVEEDEILELTTASESVEDDDILELTTVDESVENETILDIPDLELHPSLRSGKIDEAPISQKQTQTQAHRSESPDHPEATRGEIIAAMRRLISDN